MAIQIERSKFESLTITDEDGDELTMEPSFDNEDKLWLSAENSVYITKDDAKQLAQVLAEWAAS